MIPQKNINRHHFDVSMDVEDAARVRTFIKGKTMPARSFNGRKTRKAVRAMTVSDFFEIAGKKIVDGVKPDSESLKWMMERVSKMKRQREIVDEKVRNGVNRKPKSQWLKRGPKKGKTYPKYLAAMAKLAAKRRADKDILRGHNENNQPKGTTNRNEHEAHRRTGS